MDLETVFKTPIDIGEQNGSLETIQVSSHSKGGLKIQMQTCSEQEGLGCLFSVLRTVHFFQPFNHCCFKRKKKRVGSKTIFKVKLLKLNPKGVLLYRKVFLILAVQL